MQIPAGAEFILEQLSRGGYEAYLVGGCVRDTLLERIPGDYDITTSAMPDETEACFSDVEFEGHTVSLADYGRQHGTIVVVIDGECYEVTTYRVDGEYSDGRHPDNVSFTRNIEDDLSRRDFTINAMAMGADGSVIDMFNGLADLKQGIIRAVGDPDTRFGEDALRIMRAVRFAAQLGFEIDDATAESVMRNRELLSNISAERIRVELCKTLKSNGATSILRKYRELFVSVIPEIAEMFDFEQHNPYHCYDVWEHTLHVVDAMPGDEVLRLAGLLHDIGKPRSFVMKDGWGHFYGHEEESARMAEQILRRLKFDNATIADVVTVIEAHSAVFNATPKYARRKLNQLGERRLKMLIDLERADVAAQAYEVREDRIRNIDEFARIVDEVIESGQCFSMRDLKVNGKDVLACGVKPGPKVGQILSEILELVIAGEAANDRAILLAEIHRIIQRGE